MSIPAPSLPGADEQLRFLVSIQRIFSEGDFAATYKFALLSALADLAVESHTDEEHGLLIETRQIAEKFILLYWGQVLPYGNGLPATHPGVLVQNNGKQAAVVSVIQAFRQTYRVSTPQRARAIPAYPSLVTTIARTVSTQPLNFLQNFGGATKEFLFERVSNATIRLKPGVAFCLRQFYPLVQQLVRAHWIAHLKRNPRNHSIMGHADDLEHFLFAATRQSLVALAVGLKKIDGSTCFYCQQGLSDADVDHFISFSQYPRDLAHNFVLAHAACNRSKSDTLAAKIHLARWLDRLSCRGDVIAEIGQEAGLVVDHAVVSQVAEWRYAGAMESGASAWQAPRRYELVGQEYGAYFASAPK